MINELVASNRQGLEDEDGDQPDWLEIQNRCEHAVNLAGWYLTDDNDVQDKWEFPSVPLASRQYLVVFASGKNRSAPDGPLHTNFRLRAAGEYLALVKPDGISVEYSLQFPPQRPDTSFGWVHQKPEPTAPRYFDMPTPGAPNNVRSYAGWLEDVQVSQPSGLNENASDVTIAASTPGATIVYTINGSPPSVDHGAFVTSSDPAAPTRATLHISRTTTLRVIAIKDDFVPSKIKTLTYLFLDDVVTQDFQRTVDAGFPPAWGNTAADYGMDADVIGPGDLFGGRYAAQIRDSLRSVPTVSIVLDVDDMFGPRGIYTHPEMTGRDWERPASVELIHADATANLQIDAGIRIHGGASRDHRETKKKSFRLVFRGDYGSPQLEFPLFGQDATDHFDALILRASFNDGWQHQDSAAKAQYIRDQWFRDSQLAMGQVSAHGTFVHLYIDGIYWGLYNLVERPDAAFSASYLGGDQAEWDELNSEAIVDGSVDAWEQLLRMAAAVDTPDADASNSAWQRLLGNNPDGSDNPELEALLNVENFIDYMILNIYGGKTDWPCRNTYAARRRGARATGFHFYSWDAESSLNLGSTLYMNRTSVDRCVAKIYAHLRANELFRQRFAQRVDLHFFGGGALYVDPAHPAWDPEHPDRNVPAAGYRRLADEIELALVAESARWGDQHRQQPFTPSEWQTERDDLLRNYFPHRSRIVLNQLVEAGLYAISGSVQRPDLQPGDVNADSEFNERDIFLLIQARKYLTGQPASWQEGDWNGDSVFDQFDLVAALSTGYY